MKKNQIYQDLLWIKQQLDMEPGSLEEKGLFLSQLFVWAFSHRVLGGNIPSLLSFLKVGSGQSIKNLPEIFHGLEEIFSKHPKFKNLTNGIKSLDWRPVSQQNEDNILVDISDCETNVDMAEHYSDFPMGDIKVVKFLTAAFCKNNGNFWIGPSLQDFLSWLMTKDVSTIESVYSLHDQNFVLSALISKRAKKVHIANEKIPLIAQNFALILGNKNLKIEQSDPLMSLTVSEKTKLKKFDYGVACPPLGLKIRPDEIIRTGKFEFNGMYAELYYIQHLLSRCKNKVWIIVSPTFLSRSSAGERDYKAKLLKDRRIETVVQLPKFSLYGTSLAPSLLVLGPKGSCKKTLMVKTWKEDSSVPLKKAKSKEYLEEVFDEFAEAIYSEKEGPVSKFVTPEQIEDNEYDLTPKKYFAQSKLLEELFGVIDSSLVEKEQFISKQPKLDDIAEIQSTRSFSVKKEEDKALSFLEIQAENIGVDGLVSVPTRKVEVGEKLGKALQRQLVRPGDILFATKGSIGKVGFVMEDCKDNWIAGQSFVIIRSKDSEQYPQEYIFRFFRSKIGKEIVKSLNAGVAVPYISTNSLKNITIFPLEDARKQTILKDHKLILEKYQESKMLLEDARDKEDELFSSWFKSKIEETDK